MSWIMLFLATFREMLLPLSGKCERNHGISLRCVKAWVFGKTDFFHKIFIIPTTYTKYGVKV